MAEQNIGQILQAFNSIESKLTEQSSTIRELLAKVNALEGQNKQLVQLVYKLQSPAAPAVDQFEHEQHEFQDTVNQRLRSIEDQSKKTMELIKASGGSKKRAWP